MGDTDAAMRVQTRFETAEQLMNVVGAALARGSLCVPVDIRLERPFEVVLETRAGAEAVRGTAEVVAHAEDATWIRFLSAATDGTHDDASRLVLTDVEVVLHGALRSAVDAKATEPGDVYDAITAVGDRPEGLDATPAVVDEKITQPVDLRTAAALLRLSSEESPPATAPQQAVPAASGATPEVGGEGLAEKFDLSEPEAEPASAPSRAAPALEIHGDAIAELRGIEAITAPIRVIEIEPGQRDVDAARSEPASAPAQAEVVASTAEPVAPVEAGPAPIDAEPAPPVEAGPARADAPGPSTTEDAPEADAGVQARVQAEPIHADAIAARRGVEPLTDSVVKRLEHGMRMNPVVVISAGVGTTLLLAIGMLMFGDDTQREHRVAANVRSPEPQAAVAEAPARAVAPAAVAAPVAPSHAAPAAARMAKPAPAAPAAARLAEPAPAAPAAEPAPAAPPAGVAAPTITDCTIHIKSNVRKARVLVDGVERGLAPLSLPAPCDREIALELRHSRYVDFKRLVTPSGGELEVVANLDREQTELTLWSEPAGALVSSGGRALCKTPCVARVNRFEQTTLWFRAPGMDPDWRRVHPREGKKTISVKLRPNRS